MASYFLCHDAVISFAGLSLSFLCFLLFNSELLVPPSSWGGRGQAQHPVPSEGCCAGPSPLARSPGTAVLPRSLSLDAAAAPGGLGCAPRTPTRPRRRALAGEQVTRWWPTRGPSPRALSEPGGPTASRRPLPLGCPGVSRGGEPPRVLGGAGEGLSVSKVSKFKSAFLPRLTPATCATRANGEGKQKLSKVSHKCQCF